MIGRKSVVYVDNSIALEIVQRIRITENSVLSDDECSDIFAMWSTVLKQELNNITWTLPVDVGFRYMVRLHFSDTRFKIAKSLGLNVKVLINEMVAFTDSDRVEEMDSSIPWHGDYVVMMNGRKKEGKRILSICLQWDGEYMDNHGPFKGFEILKLSNPDSSLAAPNPLPLAQDSPLKTFQTPFTVLGRRNAITTIAVAALSLVNIIVYELRKVGKVVVGRRTTSHQLWLKEPAVVFH